MESGRGSLGVVTHVTYHSASIGDDRDYYVYTPPNYDSHRKDPYPVLFLLHGLGDDSAGWLTVERPTSFWTTSSMREKPSR